MKVSGALSTMWLVASLSFAGGLKTGVSSGFAIVPLLASCRPDASAATTTPTVVAPAVLATPAIIAAPAPTAHPVADPDPSSVIDQYAVLGFI
jgi:hypothetical protein